MSERRFRVVFSGEVASGFGTAAVEQLMMSTFKIPEVQVAQLFSGRRAILKNDLDAAAAEQMRQTFAKIGANVTVEPMDAAPAPLPKLDLEDAGDLYAPPSANLERDVELEDGDAHEPQRVSFGRGWSWIAEGSRVFGRSIGVWIVTSMLAFFVFLVIWLIPIVNIFAPSLLFPVFGAGLMIACHRLARGGEIAVSDLFAGFSVRPGALVGVGAVYMVGSLVVFGAIFGTMFGSGTYAGMMMGDEQAIESMMAGPTAWLAMLGGMALLLPLIAMTWFAPALIALHDVPFGRALVWSMVGCFKNFLPFLLYGIIMTVFLAAAAIPLLLGWLAAVPILICSIYVAYRDIYLNLAE